MIEAQKLKGEWIDPRLSRVTFAQWADEIESVRTVRPTTRARDEATLRNHILPYFANMKLIAIEPRHVRNWISSLEAKELAPATVLKTYQILNRIISTAVEEGRLPRSPCRGISLPRVESSDKRFLTHVEVELLVAAIDPRYRTLVRTAAYSGLRFGELGALRVGRFDPLRRTLLVEETLVDTRGHLRFGPPKTKASRRSVAVPRFLADELSGQIGAFSDSSQLIFTSPGGGLLRRSNFRRRLWLPAVVASVGLPCTFHDLRHTHAALLIAEGLHPKVIQERMGHSSIRTTLDTYGHLFEGLDALAADRLDEAHVRETGRQGELDISPAASAPTSA